MIIIGEFWGFTLIINFIWNLIPLKANEQSGTITANHLLARGLARQFLTITLILTTLTSVL